MPADESHPIGIPKKTSEVTYTDPTNSSITRHLPIPEGIIWIRSRPQPTPEPSGFEALIAIAGLLAVAYLVRNRRR
jgi:PGF-CTERM protein